VRYTEKGNVQVRLKQEPGGVAIEVVDSGIGIPAEEQGRVFKRFYVIDKSRPRQSGGTGLGFSIVKHIVLHYGRQIELKSTSGAGSTFRVFLPSGSSLSF
jgi:signal transduction histidine kinase